MVTLKMRKVRGMEQVSVRNRIFEYTCYMFMLLFGVQLAGYQYSLIYIMQEFSLNNTTLGLLSSMQFLPSLIVPLLCGGLVDRYNKRWIAVGCAAAYAVGCACVFCSASMGMLAAGIGILACGSAMAPAVLTTLLAEMDPANSNRYANMVEVFYSLGNVVAPVGLAWLIGQGMPWRGLYAIVTVGSLAVAIALSCMHPRLKIELTQAAQEPTEKFRLNLMALMLIAFAMLYNFVEPGFMTFASTYFTEAAGDAWGASISISLTGLMMVVSRMIAIRLRCAKEKMIMTGVLGAGVAGLLMAFLPVKGISVLWCVLFGFVAGPCWPMMMSVAIDCFPNSSGRMTTLIMVGGGIGGLLVSPLMGMVSDMAGIALSYLVVTLAALLGATAIWVLYRHRKRRGESPAKQSL